MSTSFRLFTAGALALTVAAAATTARAQTPAATPDQSADQTAEDTSDNQLWYRIQPLSHDPYIVKSAAQAGKAKDIAKNMIHFEHTDTTGMVWNSLTVTLLFADANEPSTTGTGAHEIYSTYRGDVSATGFGYAPITLPGVSDLQFEFGGDLNYKDDYYEARRKFLLVGPNFVLDVPGSVTFAVHLAQEWNHDGITGRDPSYHPTWNTELSYTEYFDSNHLYRLEGVFNMTGPKGNDTGLYKATGIGSDKTVTEFYNYNSFILDAGQVLGLPKHQLDLFVGVQYWVHKFGYSQKNDAGAIELTPYFGLGVHF